MYHNYTPSIIGLIAAGGELIRMGVVREDSKGKASGRSFERTDVARSAHRAEYGLGLAYFLDEQHVLLALHALCRPKHHVWYAHISWPHRLAWASPQSTHQHFASHLLILRGVTLPRIIKPLLNMPITRVRTGCLTCRRRKKKCDEKKEVCGGCKRNSFKCEWPEQHTSGKRTRARRTSTCTVGADPEYQSTLFGITEQVAAELSPQPNHQRQNSSTTISNDDIATESSASPETPPHVQLPADDVVNIVLDQDESSTIEEDENAIFNEPPELDLSLVTTCAKPELTWDFNCQISIPHNIPLLPHLEPNSYSLLAYYLSRTANSMGNGSTDANPFVVQLIPLAFSSKLLLHLLLTQSAEHRAISEKDVSKDTIQAYYGRSIRLFRKGLNSYLAGQQDDGLILTVGTLVMCLTEVRIFPCCVQ